MDQDWELKRNIQVKIVRLFGKAKADTKVTMVQVQQQQDGSSCGYFSIMFALALIKGIAPEHLKLDGTSIGNMTKAFVMEGVFPQLMQEKRMRLTKEIVIPAQVIDELT